MSSFHCLHETFDLALKSWNKNKQIIINIPRSRQNSRHFAYSFSKFIFVCWNCWIAKVYLTIHQRWFRQWFGTEETKSNYCPACRTSLIATRFWVVVICPIIKCLIVLEFSFILFDLCLFITIFNFILNYIPIVTFWIFTYHKIWILLMIFCFIWNYWIIYFLTYFGVFWSVVS